LNEITRGIVIGVAAIIVLGIISVVITFALSDPTPLLYVIIGIIAAIAGVTGYRVLGRKVKCGLKRIFH